MLEQEENFKFPYESRFLLVPFGKMFVFVKRYFHNGLWGRQGKGANGFMIQYHNFYIFRSFTC